MRERLDLAAADILPEPRSVLAAIGMSLAAGDARADRLATEAIELLGRIARPAAVLAGVEAASFETIFESEGLNEPDAPLGRIHPQARRLALFAATLGEAVDREIRALFEQRNFALGAFLDAAASEAAERAGDAVERRFEEQLAAASLVEADTLLVRYSPGYCGWDLTGQRALFAALRPEEIGIRLRESCLMEPLKSISGVIAAGPASIHLFEDAFSFCDDCATRTCRERVRRAADGRG